MPSYVVEHSYPLKADQKNKLAKQITHLHSTMFSTPSIFVHVKFQANDPSDQNYFIAGVPRTTCTNRIMGSVRTSSSRTKEHWDKLGQQIEEAWYSAVSGDIIEDEDDKNKGKRKDAINDNSITTEAKRLRAVFFQALVSVWENGDPIPLAGEEAGWFAEHRDKFQKQADAGDELSKEMMDELSTREDLKKAYGL